MVKSSRPPRSPGVVYSIIAVALLLILATIALSTRQPPPPTIAEFAPQAVERISESPTDQAGRAGVPAAAGGLMGTAISPSIPAPRPNVARARRCVGDPPRQIEDPQSPPCVPHWSGDNGGSTYRGVNRNEIRIEIPTREFFPGDGQDANFYERLRAFFSARFEFYGRNLVFVYGDATAGGDPTAQRAAAVRAADEHQVFASTLYRAAGGFYYHDELARRSVISVAGVLSPLPGSYLDTHRPYLWQYYMAADAEFANLGVWACRRLSTRTAVYAGDPMTASMRRTFGIVLQPYYEDEPTTSGALESELDRCHSPAAVSVRNRVTAYVDPSTATNVMLQMKQASVTSVFCLCNLLSTGALMKAASNQGYIPEWLLSTYGLGDINTAPVLGSWPPEQASHAFGVTFQPRQVRPELEPYRWAAREADPSYFDNGTSGTVAALAQDYRYLLLLASGIQMAGPRLTSEAFERGLQRTVFPNPPHDSQPGKVGFQSEGAHTMTIDGAEFWWLPGGQSPYGAGDSATACYLAAGARYARAEWASGNAAFFQPPCDSGAGS